jgi:DNA integrity scanning protein DisA with diadenylate cyclase activity
MGTRHRAAIGMSEHTDALVLVVSEETGKASFGMNGTLYPFTLL